MSLIDDLKQVLETGRKSLAEAVSGEALEKARVEYLGRAGKLRDLMGRIKELAAEEKKIFGQAMNEAKDALTQLHEQRQSALGATQTGPLPDPTLPGQTQPRGRRHPLTQTLERFAGIFERLGFSFADGPEIENEFHNFEALNIPADHPAREMADTFFLDNGGLVRSQTSTIQVRVMEKNPPPVRVIAPGRVYRPDAVDATHHYSFSQIEGLAVDEGITFADLKGTLGLFAREMFGSATRTRFRPSFFPFTEPSAELDISCIFCGGKGCRVCKQSGWVELGGCGMVDPNVFAAIDRKLGRQLYSQEKYTGFAFGFGIERMAMFLYGINDLRLFTENDLRFLRQF